MKGGLILFIFISSFTVLLVFNIISPIYAWTIDWNIDKAPLHYSTHFFFFLSIYLVTLCQRKFFGKSCWFYISSFFLSSNLKIDSSYAKDLGNHFYFTHEIVKLLLWCTFTFLIPHLIQEFHNKIIPKIKLVAKCVIHHQSIFS